MKRKKWCLLSVEELPEEVSQTLQSWLGLERGQKGRETKTEEGEGIDK